MDNNPGNLKSSMFGGFKKKDVLSYIFELNESTQEAQQKFAEQFEEISRSRDDLRRAVSEYESRAAGLQAEMEEASRSLNLEQAKRQEAEAMMEKLRYDIQKRERELTERENELTAANAKLLKLQDDRGQLEKEREQLELAASQIAGLLSEARADADRMVDNAKAEAKKIIEAARRGAEDIPAAAKAAAQKYIDEANATVGKAYDKFAAFTQGIARAGEALASVETAAASVKASLPEKLELDIEHLERESASRQPEPAYVEEADKKARDYTKEVLGRYGVRKDDSGFFRLAAERK
jgi:chromosome segregation ATPase